MSMFRRIQIVADKEQYFKSAYPFTCPACRHEQMAAPSIMMTGFGINTGGGRCLGCKTHLHLEIDGNNERMIATKFDEYVAKLKKDAEHER